MVVGKEKINDEFYNLIVIDIKDGKNIYKKQRPALGELPTKSQNQFGINLNIVQARRQLSLKIF